MRNLYLLILFTAFEAANAQAQNRLSGSFSTEINTDLKKASDVDKETSVSTALNFSYLFPKVGTVTTAFVYDKDLQGERKGEIKDTYISLSRKIKDFNEIYSLSGSTTVFVPISTTSTSKTFLSTGYRLKGTLGIKVPRIPNLSNSVSFGYVQNFHRSNVAISGSSNKQFVFTTSLNSTYAIWEKFSASMNFGYSKGVTYKGRIIDTYTSGEEVSYNASKKLIFGLGHGIDGTLAGARVNSNLSFFDLNRSTVYMFINLGIL